MWPTMGRPLLSAMKLSA